MRIHDLISHFSGFTSVPIDPEEVAAQIKLAGIRDHINFVGVSVDERILRGAVHTYVSATGVYREPDICSDIYYAHTLTRAWKRLVCCKELLHLLDGTVSRTATKEDFDKLITGLTSHDIDRLAPGEVQTWGDKLMVYYAIAIVFPKQSREVLLEVEPPPGFSLEEYAAEKLDVPLPVATLVLSENWSRMLIAINGSK